MIPACSFKAAEFGYTGYQPGLSVLKCCSEFNFQTEQEADDLDIEHNYLTARIVLLDLGIESSSNLGLYLIFGRSWKDTCSISKM